MNDVLANRLDMQRTVLGVLDTHADAWASVPAMHTYRDALAGHIAAARTAAQAFSRTSRPATKAKGALRNAVADHSWRLAQAIKAWAHANGRPDVAQAVHLSKDDFNNLRDGDLADFSEVVVAEAREHLPADSEPADTKLGTHGVTAAFVDHLDGLDDDFALALSTPREAIAARKGAGRALKVAVGEGQALLRKQVDPTVDFLAPDAPAFAQAYRDARIIVDRGRGPSSDPAPDADPDA